VEAPAGYGKTTTMISRIAYLYTAGKIPNPKRILALTFSVNAALKIKRDIAEKLPRLIDEKNNPTAINEKVTATNYHGFCKGILQKHGYLISSILRKDVNSLKALGDSDVSRNLELKTILDVKEMSVLTGMEETIKSGAVPTDDKVNEYNALIIEKLLPLNIITHNAVILFTIKLLESYPQISTFYQNYYPLLIIDEFQDTNCIAWKLICNLISTNTQLLFLGDPLQRIYGFIGALPDIMTIAANDYSMQQIILTKNYAS
jgi:DNA helicase-2/ATP-dependent DNA helicase PcrA